MTDETETEQKRMTVRYEGRVQGVGFRFTAVDLAGPRNVTGFVRNETDGSVTVAAEGRTDELEDLRRAIRGSHLGHGIAHESVQWDEPTGEFTGFRVRMH